MPEFDIMGEVTFRHVRLKKKPTIEEAYDWFMSLSKKEMMKGIIIDTIEEY